ncbi:hypothetical protein B0T19DRAFT_432520 [Cercophora scortea]|uniref:F-box domain-containing protein n=1 Tax=Cercophora scortea TaxID=314031 RepID=A0AAE0I6M6_9PEZI|nr:hypothetical protein B0T19DRAFT_432520 [Cercophora scortea]
MEEHQSAEPSTATRRVQHTAADGIASNEVGSSDSDSALEYIMTLFEHFAHGQFAPPPTPPGDEVITITEPTSESTTTSDYDPNANHKPSRADIILDLAPELLVMICDQLLDSQGGTDTQSLISLGRTCTALHQLVNPILYGNISSHQLATRTDLVHFALSLAENIELRKLAQSISLPFKRSCAIWGKDYRPGFGNRWTYIPSCDPQLVIRLRDKLLGEAKTGIYAMPMSPFECLDEVWLPYPWFHQVCSLYCDVASYALRMIAPYVATTKIRVSSTHEYHCGPFDVVGGYTTWQAELSFPLLVDLEVVRLFPKKGKCPPNDSPDPGSMVRAAPALKRLALSRCSWTRGDDGAPENLTILKLRDCGIEHEQLRYITQKCTQLKHFSISSHASGTYYSPGWIKPISPLDILEYLAPASSTLQELYINVRHSMRGDGTVAHTDTFKPDLKMVSRVEGFPALRELHISLHNIEDGNKYRLVELIKGCPNLEVFLILGIMRDDIGFEPEFYQLVRFTACSEFPWLRSIQLAPREYEKKRKCNEEDWEALQKYGGAPYSDLCRLANVLVLLKEASSLRPSLVVE